MASRRKSSVQGTLQPVDVNNRRFTLGPTVPAGQPSRKSLGGGRRVSAVPTVKPGAVAQNPPGQPRRQSIMPRTPNRNQTAPGKPNPRRPAVLDKDPRNLKNPKEINEMKFRLQDYLETHDYPHPLTQDNFSRPSNIHFHQMFEFLVQQRDPNFVLSEPTEEIPIILKGLGYPFTVNKSALITCGAPHTWPNLLGVLCWMVELCEYSESSGEDKFSKQQSFNTFFDFLIRAYSVFLEYGDDVEQIQKMEADIEQLVLDSCENQRQQIQRKTEYRGDLLGEIEGLKNSESRPVPLSQLIEALKHDISKFQKYIKDCVGVEETLERQYEILLQEEIAKKKDITELSSEGKATAKQLQNQELKPADIDQINSKRSQLTELYQQIHQKRTAAENKVFHRETEYNHSWENCERALDQYNEMTSKLFPGQKIDGVDLRIEIGTSDAPRAPDLKRVKPQLKHFMEELRNLDLQADDASIRIKDSVDVIRDQVTETQYIVKQLEMEKEKLEKQRQALKAQLDQELGLLYEQMEIAQRQKDEIEMTIHEMTSLSEQLIQREVDEYKRLEEELKKNHAEYFNKILETLNLVTNYKEKVQENLNNYKQQLTSMLETTF